MGKKLYYVLKIIMDSLEPVSAQDITVALLKYDIKANIKTVYSLVKRINEFCLCLTSKELIKTVRRKGFIVEDDFFEDGQLQFLLDNVSNNNAIDQKSALNLLHKLLLLSSCRQQERLNIESKNYQNLNYDLLVNLTTIIKAINNQKNITFKYVSYDIQDNHLVEVYHPHGNIDRETYLIAPYRIIVRNSIYYVVGYFNQRENSLSVYRIDRMRLVVQMRSRIEKMSGDLDIIKEFEKSVNMFSGNEHIDLKIVFHKNIIREIVSQFGLDIEVKKIDEQFIEASINDVVLSDGLIGWIMMLQDKVIVVAPESLKKNIKNRLREMIKLYSHEK